MLDYHIVALCLRQVVTELVHVRSTTARACFLRWHANRSWLHYTYPRIIDQQATSTL
jgi:hypothetical protein